MKEYPKGSEWRQWDLHIHSPASFQWNGEKFQKDDQNKNIALIDQMITVINSSDISVFALMDYWTFDGWFALQDRINSPDAPKLEKKVFPGIELRIAAPMKRRLNAHVIFSDEISTQQLKNFLSYLKLELINQPLSEEGLINYARYLNTDYLRKHNFSKEEVLNNNDIALDAGQRTAELNLESFRNAIDLMPKDMAVCFIPFDTYGGLGEVNSSEHYAFVMSLFKSALIFETRKEDLWCAFIGKKIASNENYFDAFQESLNYIPRLAVSGSDAHCFSGNVTNDKRGYGDFPNDKRTWIKADPTWNGLLQAIKEPENRCFIGNIPPKLKKISEEKSYFIDNIIFTKNSDCDTYGTWFDGCDIKLNSDLIAIIGNKGSGKSALADTIALLGGTKEKQFSFLKKDRFRGKNGQPACYFDGELIWKNGNSCKETLSNDPDSEKIELIKYIPQGRFEILCNEHASGASNELEHELRNVIFSYLPIEYKLESLNFDQLIAKQEAVFDEKINNLRNELKRVNNSIVELENNLHQSFKIHLEEQLDFKNKQIKDLENLKPTIPPQPSDELTSQQQQALEELNKISQLDNEYTNNYKLIKDYQIKLSVLIKSTSNVIEKIKIFENGFQNLKFNISHNLDEIGFTFDNIIKLNINIAPLTSKLEQLRNEMDGSYTKLQVLESEKEENNKKRQIATEILNAPQKRYQECLTLYKKWQGKVEQLIGNKNIPDSKIGIEAKLEQISQYPDELKELKSKRINITKEIYKVLEEKRQSRSKLFNPIQNLILQNELIRDEYKLMFQANLVAVPSVISETIFSIIKQNIGIIRGDEESYQFIKNIFEKNGLNSVDDIISCLSDIFNKFEEISKSIDKDSVGITPLLRKNKQSQDLYNYLFGLEFLHHRYSLIFQNTPIEQLSPGQRGALLLIFYLLIDTNKFPIVLDQPEENLDNETIVKLLVPIIRYVKNNRQVIIVTHNPNLAVLCDAEQIIVANFDRTNNSRLTYFSGSIENPKCNKLITDILEGTKPAFDNRSKKYFSD